MLEKTSPIDIALAAVLFACWFTFLLAGSRIVIELFLAIEAATAWRALLVDGGVAGVAFSVLLVRKPWKS